MTYGYLAHHGVKGQKWGVRKQRQTSGRASGTSERKKMSPETRKKIAIGVLAGLGTAAVAGGTIAAIKNPEAVKRALGSVGKFVAKTPKSTLKLVDKSRSSDWKFTSINKELKKARRAEKRTARKEFIKSSAKKVSDIIKEKGKSTATGVWEGIKDSGKKLTSEKEVKNMVSNGINKGVTTAVVAGIAGTIGIGVKTAVSGKTPTRQEVTKYVTKNPNEKKK